MTVPDHRQLCTDCGCHRDTHHPGGVCLGMNCQCRGYDPPKPPEHNKPSNNPALRWTL